MVQWSPPAYVEKFPNTIATQTYVQGSSLGLNALQVMPVYAVSGPFPCKSQTIKVTSQHKRRCATTNTTHIVVSVTVRTWRVKEEHFLHTGGQTSGIRYGLPCFLNLGFGSW